MEHELWMYGHTTETINSRDILQVFLTNLKQLFPSDNIRCHWVPEATGKPVSKPISLLSFDDLVDAYMDGIMGFSSANFNANLGWRELEGKEAERFINNTGWMQNQFGLEISPRLMIEKEFASKYIEFAKQQSVLFSVNYLESYDVTRTPRVKRVKSDLGAGLRHVHWLNIFGRPYIDIIGKEKLLETPCYMVKEVGANHIFVQLTESYMQPDSTHFMDIARQVRSYWGDGYFVKPMSEPPISPGIVGFIKDMIRTSRSFDSPNNHADYPPTFDFSKIYRF